MKNLSLAILASILVVVLLLLNFGFLDKPQIEESPDFFVGIDVAYDNIKEIKKLADEVSFYTNLFVIGSRGITHNYTRLDETCQYLYDKGLSFLVYREHRAPRSEWLEAAEREMGRTFLGILCL